MFTLIGAGAASVIDRQHTRSAGEPVPIVGDDPTAQVTRATPPRELVRGVVDITTELAADQGEAAGTGILIGADGTILTNNHVISDSVRIFVKVAATGRTYRAVVVGTARADDIAVIRLTKASGLSIARLGDSSTVRVGDPVTAVGNAGGRNTLTSSSGYVTALGRTITATDDQGGNAETLHHLIEVSARLQPGDSGGPLYDAGGSVIGLDSAGSAGWGRRTTQERRGYAIPIDDALAIAKRIQSGAGGSGITMGTRPMLGVVVGDAFDGTKGATVTDVDDDTPASAIGIEAGDVIVGIGAAEIGSADDLTKAMRTHRAGEQVRVRWVDGSGRAHAATVILVPGPAD